MATRILPPHNVPEPLYAYAYEVALGATTYRYRLTWRAIPAAWYLDLDTAEGAPLLRGVRVCCGALYGARLRDPRFPAGVLACEDTSGAESEPTRESLGAQHLLVWVTP